MKVLLAGYSKTGTKSINAALEILGYDVYDFNENFWYLGKDWLKIVGSGGTVEDLRRMYKDVDASVDVPVYTFWEELLQAFPDMKIILTIRDEDSWYKSLIKQYDEFEENYLLQLMMTITPTGRRYFAFLQQSVPVCLHWAAPRPFMRAVRNEMIMKQKFRRHNAYVKRNAPKENLLVYNVKEGWEPICQFLGKNVPDTSFPHENKGAVVFQKWMKVHPLMQRMKKELFICLSVIALVGGLGGYNLYKHVSWKSCKNVAKVFMLHCIQFIK